MGDDKGGVTFLKIFNKSETKLKVMKQKIIYLQHLEIFSEQEHILVVTEDNFEIYKVKRETKIGNVQYHDGDIIKLFAVDPVRVGNQIVEDVK